MRPQEPATNRSSFAEHQVEELLSIPLIAEFVFRSPQKINGTQREVADFLLLYREGGLLISQKCQEDPRGRDVERTERWARKKTLEATSQLCGALRTADQKPVWAEHPRRGRVEFQNGLPPIAHGIVIVEVLQQVNLECEAARLPLRYLHTPLTYLSVNDFMNLVMELRTVPEILAYLDARRSLPIPELRILGDERALFEFYLLNNGSFKGCVGRGDARVAVAAQGEQLQAILTRKRESDRYSKLLEHVADSLATRKVDYAAGLPEHLTGAFEPLEQRTSYRQMQALLGDLRLRERAELGQAFYECSENVSGMRRGFTFRAVCLDSKPEWVWVFGASRSWERAVLLEKLDPLARGAMAFYDRSRCFLVVDRDGEGYEAVISPPGFRPAMVDHEVGRGVFGKLRITSKVLN
jgi:hypothetical protein